MDFKENSFKKCFGFTIIEAIMAIFILTTGILGVFSFISHFTEYSSISTMRITASYLAQEGVEIVKNIRDGNYLEREGIVSWSEGFATSDWDGEADYKNDDSLSPYGGNYLNVDNDGFYSYSAGSQSLFQRKIHIATSTASSTYITVTVNWAEKERSHEVRVDGEIYSWPWQ